MNRNNVTASLCSMAILAGSLLSSGCTANPNAGLSRRERANLRQWEEAGLERVEIKDASRAMTLGLVFGVGSFYTDSIGMGVVGFLLWPISMAWDPFMAEQNANRINYEATEDAWLSSQGATGGAGGLIGISSVSCDIRVIKVADASVVASASSSSSAANLSAAVEKMVAKVKMSIPEGQSITVVSLQNRSGTARGRAVANEVADKVIGAMVDTGWFNVKERLNLKSIVDERDLGDAQIVNNPAVRKKLAGIKYIVIGGVTSQ